MLVLVVPALWIGQKERLLQTGTTVLLPLAPVDPRSLMQGDYMTLRYAWPDEALSVEQWPRSGRLVVRLDSAQVGMPVRRYEAEAPLGAREVLLNYQRRGGRIELGAEAFFFQEGTADRYDRAVYGELRVAPSGESVLVGLRDSSRQRIVAVDAVEGTSD